jgi:hypothetical protein
MKQTLCLLIVFSWILIGCPRPHERPPTPPSEPANAGLPPPEGRGFIRFIETAPYKQWELWPGTEPMYEGTDPHGHFLITYVNEQARRAIGERAGEMPHGAIIVKENYTPERQFDSVTAMYKIEGYNPETGDWFWIKYDAREIESEGKVEGCIAFHTGAADNDYLFTSNIGRN